MGAIGGVRARTDARNGAGPSGRCGAAGPGETWRAAPGEGAPAAARHDFTGALSWGERARQINPYSGNAYGVIGDAQTELGRYGEAFATFQHMVDLKPD